MGEARELTSLAGARGLMPAFIFALLPAFLILTVPPSESALVARVAFFSIPGAFIFVMITSATPVHRMTILSDGHLRLARHFFSRDVAFAKIASVRRAVMAREWGKLDLIVDVAGEGGTRSYILRNVPKALAASFIARLASHVAEAPVVHIGPYASPRRGVLSRIARTLTPSAILTIAAATLRYSAGQSTLLECVAAAMVFPLFAGVGLSAFELRWAKHHLVSTRDGWRPAADEARPRGMPTPPLPSALKPWAIALFDAWARRPPPSVYRDASLVVGGSNESSGTSRG